MLEWRPIGCRQVPCLGKSIEETNWRLAVFYDCSGLGAGLEITTYYKRWEWQSWGVKWYDTDSIMEKSYQKGNDSFLGLMKELFWHHFS